MRTKTKPAPVRLAQKFRNGTCFQGFADVSYARLVERLGQPYLSDDHSKVRVEWVVKFRDTVFTIYDYKARPVPVKEVRDWHIGGSSDNALWAFEEVFPEITTCID